MKNLILIAFLLLSNLSLFASKGLLFRNLTVEQGLTSNTINCIYRDYKDFIWLGTANGLNRFDGSAILSFNDFKDKSIISIVEPDTVNLYILSERELYKYNRQTRTNTRLSFAGNETPLLKKMAFDKEGNIYVVGNNGLYVLEKNSLIASSVKDALFEKKIITDIFIDKDNNCWLATLEGLIRFNLQQGQPKIYNNLPDNKLLCLAKQNDKLYIGTQNNRIVSFDVNSAASEEVTTVEATYIQTITCNSDKLYIGTNGNGLKVFDLKDKKLSTIEQNTIQNNTLSANAIYALLIDDSMFWVGTFSGGVNYIPSAENIFKTLNNKDINTSSLNIRSFCIDGNGVGIYGTRNGLVYNKNGNAQWFTIDNTTNLRSNIILSIFPFGNNYLVGTYGGGLNVFEVETRSVKKFDDASIFSETSFYSIIRSDDNTLWFGTLSGLIKYELDNKKYTVYNTQNSDIISDDIYCLMKDSSGRIWIATRGGVCYFQDGVFKQLDTIDLSFVGIVRTLFQDSENNIWLGCENQGAVEISADLSSYIHYTIHDILPDSYVSSIIEGAKGQIWMTTPKGITLYDNTSSTYRIFSLYDGISSYAFNDGAVQKTDNGFLWWGNEKGLLCLESPVTREDNKNSIFITKVVIDGFPEDSEIRKLLYAPEYQKTINLPASQKNLIFRFSDFRYDSPPSIIYEYRLEGIQDTSWHKALAGNEILIADVPNGSHILKIRKAGDQSSENIFVINKDKSYLVFWVSLVAVVLILLFVYIYKRFIRKLRNYKNAAKNKEENTKPKYQSQRIEKDELENIKLLLIQYMEKEEPYLNPDLKLDDIAQAINCPKTKISQVLNQYLDTNFSNFISKYRIEMFKKKAAEGLVQQYTLSALAKECGFSSRSSFFHTMKKLTGQTPSEFLKDAGINIKD
ncbi:MAG: two-component regulator propeller domain-containing protein [Dysgonomonas sp.]|nr:two-component regulator propeller domain-containing protein [Dysgonomonas sp.]